MRTPQYVCYYRVSTARQGESGLGLDAQRAAVQAYIAGNPGDVLEEYTELESGRKSNRPQLTSALNLCRRKRAVLLIAKLDRLARNVHFVSGLMEAGVDFLAVDQPTKDRFMIQLTAAFSEEELRKISTRTKEALAAAKRRGVVIGATGAARAKRLKAEAEIKAEQYRSSIEDVRRSGARTTKQIRDALNALNVPGPGGGRWHLPNTFRTLKRLSLTQGSGKADKPGT